MAWLPMLNQLSASAIVGGIAAGDFSALDVVRDCLARIALRDDDVKAWACLTPEQVEENARPLREKNDGPLRGLPVGVKDIMDTADMPTEYGSGIYAGHRPRADAACVSALRAAGAIILGKTATTEFAAVHPAQTRNPLSLSHTPGGSSSGSAAAVADWMVPVALGTQTMGSVIRPAAYCGVVGYKPSFGLINRAGVKSQAESVDTIGLFARALDDIALVAPVLMGADPKAFAGLPDRPPRISIFRGPHWTRVEPHCRDMLRLAADCLVKADAIVEDVDEPVILAAALDAHFRIVAFELARALSFEWSMHRERLSRAIGDLIRKGRSIPFSRYLDDQKLAAEARAQMSQSFARADLWMTVSALGEAPEGLANTGDPVMNRLWSMMHLPVMTVPFGKGSAGLPLGIQLIGPFREDAQFMKNARYVSNVLKR